MAGGAAIVSTEVMVVALRNDRQSRAAFAKSYAMNVNANHKNAKAFRDGKITPEVRDKVRLKALRQRSGIQPGSSEDARLREAPWEAFRSLVCEEEATKLMWELKYEMNPNQLHDIWHLVVAMPYTDFIITAEVKLRQMMDAIKNRVAFQTAAIPASIAELFGAI